MGNGTRSSYALKHRPRSLSGFDGIEDHRYGLLPSNGGLIFICLIATMIGFFGAIRMPNACTKP
jgi:hypothetical protein